MTQLPVLSHRKTCRRKSLSCTPPCSNDRAHSIRHHVSRDINAMGFVRGQLSSSAEHFMQQSSVYISSCMFIQYYQRHWQISLTVVELARSQLVIRCKILTFFLFWCLLCCLFCFWFYGNASARLEYSSDTFDWLMPSHDCLHLGVTSRTRLIGGWHSFPPENFLSIT